MHMSAYRNMEFLFLQQLIFIVLKEWEQNIKVYPTWNFKIIINKKDNFKISS